MAFRNIVCLALFQLPPAGRDDNGLGGVKGALLRSALGKKLVICILRYSARMRVQSYASPADQREESETPSLT